MTLAPTNFRRDEPADRLSGAAWVGCGAALLAVMAGLVVTYRRAGDVPPPLMSPATVALLAAGAVVYFFAVALARWVRGGRRVWVWIALVAVGMRAAMLLTPDVLLDDYQRYLWDGAVVAAGENPYRHAPAAVHDRAIDSEAISRLADRDGGVVERINNPKLRTIYPPVAEGLFALAHFIRPFDRLGLQVVYAALEVLAALMVVALLRRAGLPVAYLVAYLWNPLLVVDVYRSVHVDLAAGVFVLAFVYLLASRRPVWAGGALALAAGVKLWPAVLVVFLVFTSGRRRWRAVWVFAVLLGAMAGLYLSAAGDSSDSGLLNYAARWRANGGVFAFVEGALVGRMDPAALRMVVGGWSLAVTLGVGMILARRTDGRPASLAAAVGLTIVCMLLMGPTLLTWYAIALIPLAAVAPRPALLAWTLLLPLLYLPLRWMHPTAALAVAHGVVWVLLAWGVMAMLRSRSVAEGASDV